MDTKKVVMVIAHQGYQPIEFNTPKKLLEEAGYTVIVASDQKGNAIANDESATTVDVLVADTSANQYLAVILVGGPGSLEHLDNADTYRLVQDAYKQHKIIAAICLATRILAKAGILEGKAATGWDGDNKLGALYKKHLVNYISQDVVTNGTVITAQGPSAARKFGQSIISMIQSQSSWG